MIISKELFEVVMGLKINCFISEGSRKCKPNTIVYEENDYDNYKVVNIYELAHKCKIWALDLDDKYYFVEDNDAIEVMLDDTTVNLFYSNFAFEPEATFKACEWILEQRQK